MNRKKKLVDGNGNINISKLRVKQNGEIFTPPKLVDEMLDTIPVNTWKKKNLKALDPCVGATCVFPIMMMFRFCNGLRDEIPNPAIRVKHIIEQIIHTVEIDKDSYEHSREILIHYGRLLTFFLLLNDSKETVESIKKKYVENYQGIIDNFYQKLNSKNKKAS
jgi:hypothetical protein